MVIVAIVAGGVVVVVVAAAGAAAACRYDTESMCNCVLTIDESGGRFGLISSDDVHTASMTAGLVQEYDHHVLPSVRPLHTLISTIVATVVSLSHICLTKLGLHRI